MTQEQNLREQQAWELLQHHLGVLLDYMRPEVTELMVNPDGKLWIDTHEGMRDTGEHLAMTSRRTIIQTVASHLGKVCNEAMPQLDGTLPVKGFRFSGLVEPAVSAPAFAIRLHDSRHRPLEEYVHQGALTREQARLLVRGVKERKNILLVGGTGSGKTTFANALLERIGRTGERVMTIEDTPELRCPAPNHLPVYVKRESSFEYRHALHAALRLRPDRIIVGELRDGLAALELLKMWNTGHNGGLATLHANNAANALPRMEQLLEEEVARVPRALLAEAIDLVVYIERHSDEHGQTRRRIRDVAELDDALNAQGNYQLKHHFHSSIDMGVPI